MKLLLLSLLVPLINVAIADPIPLIESGSYRYCSATTPCPNGYSCGYGPLAPDTKICFFGNTITVRNGRCPLAISNVVLPVSNFQLQQRCNFDSDCQSYSQKCCYNSIYAIYVCTTATQISISPVVTPVISGSSSQSSNGFVFESSIGLVQSGGKNVLFETGTPGQRSAIIKALKNTAGLSIGDIHYAINSHGHPDHLSNNGMFPDTPISSYTFEVTGSNFKPHPLGQNPPGKFYILNDNRMELIRTPGHTMQDVSLMVYNVTGLGTVSMVGDLIMDETDAASIDGWQKFSSNVDVQKANRRYILCSSDWILPGHGKLFKVTPAMRDVIGGCVGAALKVPQ